MRMDLKVWVDGVQRVVCGVTEFTTCQEVVIALAQAIGRTGRYTLIEKWRETERHIAPSESPVVSLNKWGQFAGDVQLILHRSGPSASERQVSGLLSARVLSRQSLPPLAKLRPAADCALKRCEPKRKSLAGRARSLREIFVKRKTTDGSQQPCRDIGGRRTECEGSACDLGRLVQLQKDKLQVLENLLLGFETVLDEDRALEVLILEQQVRKNNTEIEEEEFWQDEFQMELESEQLLRLQLEQLQHQLLDYGGGSAAGEWARPDSLGGGSGSKTRQCVGGAGDPESACSSPGGQLEVIGGSAVPDQLFATGEGAGTRVVDKRTSTSKSATVYSEN
ncbi:ras association domain-containing protein 8-like isoform 4-T5 [Synchiropus picturatus]